MQRLSQISPSPGVIPGATTPPQVPLPSPAGLPLACGAFYCRVVRPARGIGATVTPAIGDKSRVPTTLAAAAGECDDRLFELSMPWWEFVLRAAAVYVVLLVLIRLSGKRTMGQFTPFDMLLIVLLGNAVQNALLGKDTSLLGGLLLAAMLIALNWCVGFVTSRSQRAERLVEGVPVVLARDGQLFRRTCCGASWSARTTSTKRCARTGR